MEYAGGGSSIWDKKSVFIIGAEGSGFGLYLGAVGDMSNVGAEGAGWISGANGGECNVGAEGGGWTTGVDDEDENGVPYGEACWGTGLL